MRKFLFVFMVIKCILFLLMILLTQTINYAKNYALSKHRISSIKFQRFNMFIIYLWIVCIKLKHKCINRGCTEHKRDEFGCRNLTLKNKYLLKYPQKFNVPKLIVYEPQVVF